MTSIRTRLQASAAALLPIAAFAPAAESQTLDFLNGAIVNGPIVRNSPYSAEGITTVTQVLADGTRIERRVTAKIFRDGAGRVRREQTVLGLAALTPSNESQGLITIVDPVAGASYVLSPSTHMGRRTPLPATGSIGAHNDPGRTNRQRPSDRDDRRALGISGSEGAGVVAASRSTNRGRRVSADERDPRRTAGAPVLGSCRLHDCGKGMKMASLIVL